MTTKQPLFARLRLRWLRYQHATKGHPLDKWVLIDKMRSEKHPHSDAEHIYTVNLHKCTECGLHFLDAGLEFRK